MEDRLSRLEKTVEQLGHSLQLLEHRLAVLESRPQLAPEPSASPAASLIQEHALTAVTTADASAVAGVAVAPRYDLASVLADVGRTFVVLGGAYLLRALTDSGTLPAGAGLTIGLAYGLFWLGMADRDGAAGRLLSAVFHGLVAVMIMLPLVWEAAVRFNFIGPPATAAALAIVSGATLLIAARRHIYALAWIVTAGVLPEALGLIVKTTAVVPFAVFLIGLGIATLWISYMRHWRSLRWPVAMVADLAVLALALKVASGSWTESATAIVAVQLMLLTTYVVSIGIRTLRLARDVVPFEVFQAFAALGIGFGGAVYVARAAGAGVLPLAVMNLIVGAACYAVAFIFVAHRQGLRRNFYFYTSLALVLVIISTALLLDSRPLAVVWGAIAIVATVVAQRLGRVALNLHAAVYLIGAAVMSGLATSAAFALIGPVNEEWARFTTSALVVLLAALACWAVPLSARPDWGAYSRLPRFLILVAMVWSLGGLIVAAATPPLCGIPGAGADAGIVATVRTTVLAISALLLARIGRIDRFHEAGWLLYPLLVAGGAKLLLEDFPHSRPATLFVALAVYGVALIVAPRLARRTQN